MAFFLFFLFLSRLGFSEGESEGESDIHLQAEFTYGNVVSNCWNPVSVEVSNLGKEDRQFEVWLGVSGQFGVSKQYFSYLPLALPAGSTKHVTLYAILGIRRFQAQVWLEEDGRRVKQTKQFGWYQNPNSAIVLSIDSRPGAPTALSRLTMPPDQQWQGNQKIPLTVVDSPRQARLDKLPDRWIGYEIFDFILLHDAPLNQMRPAQQRALLDYVLLGGSIGISIGKDSSWAQQSLVRDLLGDAELQRGHKSLSFHGGPRPGTLKIDGTSIHSDKFSSQFGTELIARRRFGLGWVWFFGFDVRSIAFQEWNVALDFWKRLIESTPKSRPRVATAKGQYGRDFRQAPEITKTLSMSSMPSLYLVGGLMLFYLVAVGPVNFLLLHKYRIHPYLIYTVPLIAAGFIILIFISGYASNGFSTASKEISFVEPLPDTGRFHAVKYLGLKPSTTRNFTIELDDYSVAYPVYSSEETMREANLTIRLEPKFRIEKFRLRMWENGYLRIESLAPSKGRLEMKQAEDGLEIWNRTDMNFKDCLLSRGRNRWHELGGVAPEKSVMLPWSDNLKGLPFNKLKFFINRNAQAKLFNSRLGDHRPNRGSSMFVALIDKDPLPIKINRRVSIRSSVRFLTYSPSLFGLELERFFR